MYISSVNHSLHYPIEVIVNRIALFISVVLVLASTGTLWAQAQKVGFVNSTKIFREFPEAQDAQKKLDAVIKPLQDELEAKQRELQQKYEEYQKKEGLMNETAKKAEQQQLIELEQKLNAFKYEKFGDDGALAKEQEKLLEPIKKKILTAIERVAKEEKYAFVFDQTEQVKVLLYGDAAHDLTFKVIDKLKRGK